MHGLLDGENFGQLEAVIQALRAKDTHYQGMSGRHLYYSELSHPEDLTDQSWEQHIKHLKNWLKARPDSPTPHIVLAGAWTELAWAARGSGYANTVTSDGWKKFTERIESASKLLEAAVDEKPADPEVYVNLITLAKARDWSREQTFAALEKGIKLDSECSSLYEQMAVYLEPQWHGRPGDVQRFAADMRKRFGGELGDAIYFRIACERVADLGDGFFSDSNFLYDELLPGIRILLRDYPESGYYFNAACQMACLANDKKLARLMLARLDPATFWSVVWKSYARIEHWRRFVDPGSYQGEDVNTFSALTGWVRGVAFLGETGKLISAGYEQHFEVWDLAAENMVDRFEIDKHVRNLAIDASGTHVIVSTGEEETPDSEALVYDYGLQGSHTPRILKGHTASVNHVAISRDGKRYGTAARDNTAKIWQSTDLEKPLTLKHPEWVYDITFSADGKTAATSSYQGGLWLWNADKGNAGLRSCQTANRLSRPRPMARSGAGIWRTGRFANASRTETIFSAWPCLPTANGRQLAVQVDRSTYCSLIR
jgi:hypothetical protein